ncbi:Aldo/keto reductase [Punctularia strigosozonata HHB-11173 SS5]|uniref:Aldo/keto reductase n=1 Tax=Punctularia strigosozonata (strain HHB-11173) TaxID=741275 RepID=R7S5K1_PUNST|nr:Aldo/keto reductase [Punctularia strigosozonata HHB-11173 SS5]EIN04701.1 Aldo/keto reductase [Punctularia strigosozonata HHB-11173 SS5]
MQAAPPPPGPLGRYRLLSPTAGLRVSPLCLGAMNFGEGWKELMGECSKETAFEILDYFYEQGGNFIDTANAYQGGDSERWLGGWMASRKNRDEMVISTKYTVGNVPDGQSPKIRVNYQGNHMKSMNLSLESSLQRLQTSFIDILYVHMWDFSTPVEEVMIGLNRLVMAGKVNYLGISDCPAWIVVKANNYARQHGLAPFVLYQGRFSAANRDVEREVLPMCEDQGLGFCAFGTLGSGNFKTKEQREKEAREGVKGRNSFTNNTSEHYIKITNKLAKLAAKKNTHITSVAMAYAIQKAPYIFPLIGCRTLEQLKSNVEALKLKLTEEEIKEIEAADTFEPGYPFQLVFQMYNPAVPYHARMTISDIPGACWAGVIEAVEKPRAIHPHS